MPHRGTVPHTEGKCTVHTQLGRRHSCRTHSCASGPAVCALYQVAVANCRTASLCHASAACSVSKNVQDLPSNIHKTAAAMPSQRAVMHFAGLLGAGIFFMSLAFFVFLPIIAIAPQKFALCFTVGSSLAMGAFFALKGPAAQLESMLAPDVSNGNENEKAPSECSGFLSLMYHIHSVP